jgi:hypothetical protein
MLETSGLAPRLVLPPGIPEGPDGIYVAEPLPFELGDDILKIAASQVLDDKAVSHAPLSEMPEGIQRRIHAVAQELCRLAVQGGPLGDGCGVEEVDSELVATAVQSVWPLAKEQRAFEEEFGPAARRSGHRTLGEFLENVPLLLLAREVSCCIQDPVKALSPSMHPSREL